MLGSWAVLRLLSVLLVSTTSCYCVSTKGLARGMVGAQYHHNYGAFGPLINFMDQDMRRQVFASVHPIQLETSSVSSVQGIPQRDIVHTLVENRADFQQVLPQQGRAAPAAKRTPGGTPGASTAAAPAGKQGAAGKVNFKKIQIMDNDPHFILPLAQPDTVAQPAEAGAEEEAPAGNGNAEEEAGGAEPGTEDALLQVGQREDPGSHTPVYILPTMPLNMPANGLNPLPAMRTETPLALQPGQIPNQAVAPQSAFIPGQIPVQEEFPNAANPVMTGVAGAPKPPILQAAEANQAEQLAAQTPAIAPPADGDGAEL